MTLRVEKAKAKRGKAPVWPPKACWVVLEEIQKARQFASTIIFQNVSVVGETEANAIEAVTFVSRLGASKITHFTRVTLVRCQPRSD